jgi:hypothetical protein
MAMPTTGALLINPRKRRRKTTRKRKTTSRRRRNTSSARRSTAAKKAAATRRRNAAARSRAAKRAAATRRRNGTHKGQTRKTARRAYMKRRRNTRKGQVRKTARRAYARRRNTRKGQVRKTARRAYTRRRNPNVLAGLQQSVKRIPVIGGAASDAVGLGIPALFGAISIEPVMMGLKFGGQYIPAPLQKMSFTIGGMVMGALIKNMKFLGTPELRKQFAVAVATAGGAVDYYRWKTGQGTVTAMAAAEKAGWGELEIESLEELDGLGELELAVDGWGDLEIAEDMSGFGDLELAVDGFGDYDDEDDFDGWAGWDALETGDDDDDDMDGFGDVSLADAEVSGDDMSAEEIGAFYAAPMQQTFRRRMFMVSAPKTTLQMARPRMGLRAHSGAQRPTQYYYRPGDLTYTGRHSRHAGTKGGRWFWLIKVIGYQKTRQVAALPAAQRREYIARLRASATRVHNLRMSRSTGVQSSPMYATA